MGLFLLLYSWCCCFLSFSPSSSPSYFFFVVPLSMEWNVPSACAPTVHARTNYWIGTEQKILFLCVSVSGDSLSLCSPRCWLHVTCAIWTKDFFFFSFGLHLEPIPTGPDGLGGFVAGHHFQKSSLQSICIHSRSQPVYQYQSCFVHESFLLSLLFDSRMIRHLVNNKVIYKYKLSLQPADMYFV